MSASDGREMGKGLMASRDPVDYFLFVIERAKLIITCDETEIREELKPPIKGLILSSARILSKSSLLDTSISNGLESPYILD